MILACIPVDIPGHIPAGILNRISRAIAEQTSGGPVVRISERTTGRIYEGIPGEMFK